MKTKRKKKVFTKNETLFSANSSAALRLDADQSQTIEGDAAVDHTQIIGKMQSNYWGKYIPYIPPPGFGTPGCTLMPTSFSHQNLNNFYNF